MKRATFKAFNQEYKGFILIENMTDLVEFRHEKTYGLMKNSARELVARAQAKEKGEYVPHTTDAIINTTEVISEVRGGGILFNQAHLMGGVMNHQDKAILEGKKIAINPFNMVSYFTIPEGTKIKIISEKEKYTRDDIKVSRWPGGVHWYAKVSTIDVIIDDEQKWGAKWVAQKKAEEFLENLQNK